MFWALIICFLIFSYSFRLFLFRSIFDKYFHRNNSNITVLFHTYFHISGKMTGTRFDGPLLFRDEDGMCNCHEIYLHIYSNTFVEVATIRVFVVGHKFILSDLKELAHPFGLKWNVYTFRSGFTSRKSKYLHQGLRSTTTITCGC